MNPHYPAVASRAGHRCEYCRAPEAVFNFPFEVEHIVPIAREGADVDDNRALACRACNVRKGAEVEDVDPVNQGSVRLSNPRSDRWPDHFGVDRGEGVIEGRTPIGRASIKRLRMNTAVQRVVDPPGLVPVVISSPSPLTSGPGLPRPSSGRAASDSAGTSAEMGPMEVC